MTDERQGRLVILSGPSCVGKSPLAKALAKFYPELRKTLRPLVLYNSRGPRPGEVDGVDYHFRSREQIEKLKSKDHFVVLDVRGDLQALDLHELSASLAKGDVFFEGNAFVGRALQTVTGLAEVNRLSVFLSPLSRDEILFLKAAKPGVSLPDFVADVMRRKLPAPNTEAEKRAIAEGPGGHRKTRLQRPSGTKGSSPLSVCHP